MPEAAEHAGAGVDPKLHLRFCEIDFASPIVLLSGCVGFGDEYTRIEGFSNREAGAICLKGITLKPREGNPAHRVIETPDGMLNSIGLQNPGIEGFFREKLPMLDFGETRFIANISGASIEEYGELARRLDDSPIDAIEINVSCPNVKEGGLVFGNDPASSARVVEICREATSKVLITKLSPNQTSIAENARQCIEAGSDALAAINTVTGLAIDIETRRPILGSGSGGLSGPAIKPIALCRLAELYPLCKAHGIPIIGQGGIVSAEDAIEFIIAGASAVGIGTGLFYDPLLCRKINHGICEYLDRHRLSGISELTGTLQPASG